MFVSNPTFYRLDDLIAFIGHFHNMHTFQVNNKANALMCLRFIVLKWKPTLKTINIVNAIMKENIIGNMLKCLFHGAVLQIDLE